MVSIPLVIGLIFLGLTIVWAIKSKEFLLALFAVCATVFLSSSKPEIPKAIFDFFSNLVKIVIDIFN